MSSSSPSKSPTMEHPHPKAANSVSPTIKQHPLDEAEYHHPNHPLIKSESEDNEFSDEKRRLQKEKDASDVNFLKSFPPGFRFNPHDEELVLYYLQKKINGLPLPPNRIMEVNLYLHNPETLAERYERYGEKEWYFFTPRDRKYPNGTRPNRAAGDGYWKATGADRPIRSDGLIVGYRKALVFYMGKAPKGTKTNWIMHEFRVFNSSPPVKRTEKDMRLDHWVLCRIYKKEAGGKNIKNQGTNHEEDPEEEEIISAPSPEDLMNKMEEMSSASQQSDVTNFNRPPMEYSVHANPDAAAILDSTLMAYFDYYDPSYHHHHPAASPLVYGEANPNYQHPHFQVDLIDNNVFHQTRLHQVANSYASMGQKQFAPSPTDFSNQKYDDHMHFPDQKKVTVQRVDVVTFSNNQSVQPVEVPSMQQAQSVQPVLNPVPSMQSTHQEHVGVKQSQSLPSDQGFQDDLEYLKFIDPDLLH